MSAVICILFAFSLFAVGYAGKVGECRTECAEQNSFKIVRVHLRETNVSAGLCQNTTKGAKVVEFICDLKVGIWIPDIEAEEPFSFFPTSCPSVTIVEESEMATCPGDSKTIRTSSAISAVPDSAMQSNAATTTIPDTSTESNTTTTIKVVPTPIPKKEDEKSATEPIKAT